MIQSIAVIHGCHIGLDQIVLSHVTGQDEARVWNVFNVIENVLEAVDHVKLLNFEPG